MTLRPDSPDLYERILHAVGSAFDSLNAWPDHPHALATVADAVEQLIEKELAGPQAALAALHEGEEEPTAVRLSGPTPVEWIWSWNRATPAERLKRAALIIDAGQRAGICFQMAHETTIQRLRVEAEGARRVQLLHPSDHGQCPTCRTSWPCPTIAALNANA